MQIPNAQVYVLFLEEAKTASFLLLQRNKEIEIHCIHIQKVVESTYSVASTLSNMQIHRIRKIKIVSRVFSIIQEILSIKFLM